MASSRTGNTVYMRNRATLMRQAQQQGLTHCPGWTDTRETYHPCGRELNYQTPRLDESAEADHIVPHKYGGTDNLDNLTVLCRKCNNNKSDGSKTPPPITPPNHFPTTRQW